LVHEIIGFDDSSLIYGVHRYLSLYGIGFFFDGPQLTLDILHHSNAFPLSTSVSASPKFELSGLQPFHDFFEGPDTWSEDFYKEIAINVAALGGNVIGLHTYPAQNGPPPEPATWIGLPQFVNDDGSISGGGYPTSWANTLRLDSWGYNPMNTSDFGFGAAQLFDHDCWGHELQKGNASLCPLPLTQDDQVYFFNQVGKLWQSVFSFSQPFGVAPVIGTESPITLPPLSPSVPIPLNIYYSKSRDDHFVTTTSCDECDNLYDFVGIEGYVFSSPTSISNATLIPLSTYWSSKLNDNILLPGNATPPDASYAFVRIEGYALVDDSAFPFTSGPLYQYQRAHAGSAGVDHWAISSLLVQNATNAGYVPSSADPIAYLLLDGPAPASNYDYYLGTLKRFMNLFTSAGIKKATYWIWTPEEWEWNKVSIDDPVVQNVVWDSRNITSAAVELNFPYELSSCGWVVGPAGARWYWDTILPSNWTISSIDMDVGNTNIDPAYANITHRTKKQVIPWAEDDPGLTAPELWVNRSIYHLVTALSYNVTSFMIIFWRTRMTSPVITATMQFNFGQISSSDEFFDKWANIAFSNSLGPQMSSIFKQIDSQLPRPVNWIGGPGGMSADSSQCSAVSSQYGFVDDLVALYPSFRDAFDNGRILASQLENYQYWTYQFIYMRYISVFECDWANYNALFSSIAAITDPVQRQQLALSELLPARVNFVTNMTNMLTALMNTVSTPEGLGTVVNVLTHSLNDVAGPVAVQQLLNLTNLPNLPANATIPTVLAESAPPRLAVLVKRGEIMKGESYRIEAVLLANPNYTPTSINFMYRNVSGGASEPFLGVPMTQAAPEGGVQRLLFRVSFKPVVDFQWYINCTIPVYTSIELPSLGLPASTRMTGSVFKLYHPETVDVPVLEDLYEYVSVL
jgi:hypothetical protein